MSKAFPGPLSLEAFKVLGSGWIEVASLCDQDSTRRSDRQSAWRGGTNSRFRLHTVEFETPNFNNMQFHPTLAFAEVLLPTWMTSAAFATRSLAIGVGVKKYLQTLT